MTTGIGPYRQSTLRLEAPDEMTLWRPWRSTTVGGLAAMAFLTLFMVAFVGSGFVLWLGGSFELNGAHYATWRDAVAHDSSALVFLFGYPLVGLLAGYIPLAIVVNRTTITASPERLLVRRGPLPWPRRGVDLPSVAIRQLYVEAYESHEENERSVTAYRVMAELDGRVVCVDRGMGTVEDARLLEQLLEEKLGIANERVAGEA